MKSRKEITENLNVACQLLPENNEVADNLEEIIKQLEDEWKNQFKEEDEMANKRKLVEIKRFQLVGDDVQNNTLNAHLKSGYEIEEIYQHTGNNNYKPHTVIVIGKYE